MVVGNSRQAYFRNRHGGGQRDPDLGSNTRYSPRDRSIKEKPEYKRDRFSPPKRSSIAPNEFWTLIAHSARNRFRSCFLVLPGSKTARLSQGRAVSV